MWWGPGQDPGGSGTEGPPKDPPQNQQLQDLQEQFESQQTLIAQLKEMLKKTEHSTSVSREKVEEYASTLSKMNERAKRNKLRKSDGARTEDDKGVKQEVVKELTSKKSTSIVNPAKEKVNLLRQQMEENKLKLAQRDKNQKGIEEMVNQLKAQLDDSQIMISQSSINLPKSEPPKLTPGVYTTEMPKDELISILTNKDKQLEELNERIQQLQVNVLDLQENIKEKDSVIDARTKAITLLSENLSKKGKNTLDMLDETKEQMRSMQEQFVDFESKMNEENTKLLSELDQKNTKINELLQQNNQLGEEKHVLELQNCNLEKKINESEERLKELTRLNEELENSIADLKSRESSVERSPSGRKSKNWKKKSEADKKISELEKSLGELKVENEQLLSQVRTHEIDDQNEKIESLEKQLETMNKNMIKMKAQYKAKLKESQKKLTPGEINEKVLNLESEIVKLEQNIVELEEEKGNLQLRLVDVDNTKDKEHISDLENRIEEQKMEIENHIRVITNLEKQMTDKSVEISTLRNELCNLMNMENAQVCSEITSVQLEEQLDKEQIQKKELENRFEELNKEKDELLEKIEDLNKEKQEMNTKMLNLTQENMELIDRLEKSSAEKVSSAESIEIVESLTHQEKLEIEAYQKNLEYVPPDKELDPTAELHESVKLTADSSDLLERIEQFTVERREVMEKMESLLSDKEHLLDKLKIVDNERKELMEKYEAVYLENNNLRKRVDTLKDVPDGATPFDNSNAENLEEKIIEYKIMVENQKMEIASLRQELDQNIVNKNNLEQVCKEKEGLEVIVASLNEQFYTMHKEYDSFMNENQRLKAELKKSAEIVHEKDDEDSVIRELRSKIVALETKVTEDLEENKSLQEIIQDNKTELVQSAEHISKLTKALSSKQTELSNYQTELLNYQTEADQLRNIIQQLNKEIENKAMTCELHIETIDNLSTQMEELKIDMRENMEELHKYDELNIQIKHAEETIDNKEAEINQLLIAKSDMQGTIVQLQQELQHKNEHFKEVCEQLKHKCMALEGRIQSNSGDIELMRAPFEAKIRELETECTKLQTKNKEQIEKMKKIAATLKKKTQAHDELNEKLTALNEKYEKELSEKDDRQNKIEKQQQLLAENKTKINSLMEQIKEMKTELNNVQVRFENKELEYSQLKMNYENHLHQFEDEKIKLQNTIQEYIEFSNNLQVEKNNYEKQLAGQTESENLLRRIDAMDVKLQEKDLYIETLENENTSAKEKFVKLNEGLMNMEERRRSLEQRALQLGEELEAKSEALLSENILENRLATLIAHDNIIENRLKEITTDNQVLTEKNDLLNETNLSLQGRLLEMEMKFKEKESDCEKMENLESDSVQLREIISSLEHEIKTLHLEYNKKIENKQNEIETSEQEHFTQLQELNEERKTLLNRCEIFQDKIQEFKDNENVLTDEIEALKQKLYDAKTDLDKYVEENLKLQEVNSNMSMSAELLTEQNHQLRMSGEDIHLLQQEINDLRNIVAEQEKEIENYRRQNMSLQMSMSFGNSSVNTPEFQEQILNLENSLRESVEKVKELENTNTSLMIQIQNYSDKLFRLENELSEQTEMLLRKTAEHHVDDILRTAHQVVQEIPVEETFVKTVAEGVESERSHTASVETKEEDLTKKIKALEMLLYNMEKERDEAVSQCHELSNELTRLIYEREGLLGGHREQRKEIDIGKLECEIETNPEASDPHSKQEMQKLEYSPVREPVSGTVPVQEDVIKPSTSYSCFLGPTPSTSAEDDKIREILESQIIKEDITRMSPADRKELQQLEYSRVNPPQPHDKPVSDKVPPPKSPYLCYPDDTATIDVGDAFACEEDGWGWNAEEVKLEAKHQQQLSVAPNDTNLALNRKIEELEAERNKLLEDIKTQHVKTAKLVKKIKELKMRNENFAMQLKQKSMGDFDLDMAIQDELNTQIKTLETKLKESNEEKMKDRSEKENIIKRVDMLTAANERMVEMKEKQDNEIQMLQFNNRQLSTKIEQLEWGEDVKVDAGTKRISEAFCAGDEPRQETEELVRKIEELNGIINDLTMDNEDMQVLLEEQRKLRLDAEKALSSQPIHENMKTEQEYLKVQHERDIINTQLLELSNEKWIINEKILEHAEINRQLTVKISELIESVRFAAEEKKSMKIEYMRNLENLQKENVKLHKQICGIMLEVESTAEQSNEIVKSEIQHLRMEIRKLEDENVCLQAKLTELSSDKTSLESKLRDLTGETTLSQNISQIEDLGSKLEFIIKEIQFKNKEVEELNKILNVERTEFEQKFTVTLEQLAHEWADRVEQRGADVAESWKLHVEARENEFVQLEQNLRLELDELCNKNETLVTENNELQKRVDLLLQERQAAESDNKMEALQQVLEERKTEIISLSQQLQDVTVQLEVRNNELVSLQQIIDSMQKTNYELVQKNNESSIHEIRMKSLVNEIKDLENEITKLKNRLKQNDEVKSQLEVENKELKTFSKRNEELNVQLRLENQEIEILKETIGGLKQESSKLRDELSKEKSKSSEYDNHITYLQENIHQQELKLQELINSLESPEMIYDGNVDRFVYIHQAIDQTVNRQNELYQRLQQIDKDKPVQEEIEELNSDRKNLEETIRNLYNEVSLLKEKEKEYEKENLNKDLEIENLHRSLNENVTQINLLNSELQSKLSVILDLESRINELTESTNAIIVENDKVVQEKLTEIDELKQELERKSEELACVIEEFENLQQVHHKQFTTPQLEKHVHFKEPVTEEESKKSEDDSVSRAELDIALYMLHQRDVRCEELTVELMQLLEERDTLQLRLSNAIRINEELRGKVSPQKPKTGEEMNTPKVIHSTGAIPKSKDIVLKATGTELATEATETGEKTPIESREELDNKLSQLRSVGYNRDKTLKDDQEIRYLQQMSIMQQHRDLASRLPPEAAAKLVDASYTLSRDVQSPSKVLLNWLWGKSTPKVNDV